MTLYAALAATVLTVFLVTDDWRLRSNLKSTTRITQNLRDELDGLRQENRSFKEREINEQSHLENLSAELDTLKQDKSLSSSRQQELEKMVGDAELQFERLHHDHGQPAARGHRAVRALPVVARYGFVRGQRGLVDRRCLSHGRR